MAIEVPPHIHTRLVDVVNDLRNVVEQKATTAVLTSFIDAELVGCVPDVAVCDDDSFRMEFIDENFVADASPSNTPSGTIEDSMPTKSKFTN